MDEELDVLFEPFEAAAMVGDCADALPRAQSLEQDSRSVVRAAVARLLGTTLVASLPSFWADASPQLPPELPAASALLERLLDDTDSDVAVAAALAASSAYRAGVMRAAAAAAVAISAGPSEDIEAQRDLVRLRRLVHVANLFVFVWRYLFDACFGAVHSSSLLTSHLVVPRILFLIALY